MPLANPSTESCRSLGAALGRECETICVARGSLQVAIEVLYNRAKAQSFGMSSCIKGCCLVSRILHIMSNPESQRKLSEIAHHGIRKHRPLGHQGVLDYEDGIRPRFRGRNPSTGAAKYKKTYYKAIHAREGRPRFPGRNPSSKPRTLLEDFSKFFEQHFAGWRRSNDAASQTQSGRRFFSLDGKCACLF